MAGYTGGRIKRIRMQNFMTYNDLEMIPGKGLNLIVGLNGSGKSSIMCAICLGLAGKPQFTGRAPSLADFIKHGQEQAEIEIELETARGGSVIITRRIKGDKGEWHLNQNVSNLAEVTNVVKSFNIDTSNLCQFLPQEKVVEFSRMNKIQRLENLLQAIGEPRLFTLFNELKDMFKKCIEIENLLMKSQQNKSTAEEKNDRIFSAVKMQENRSRLKEKLEELFRNKQVKEYEILQNEVKILNTERKSLQKELTLINKKKADATVKENSIISKYQQHANTDRKLKQDIQALSDRSTDNSNSLANLDGEIQDAKIEYENKLEEKEAHSRKLTDISKQIESLEEQLAEETNQKATIDEKFKQNASCLSELQSDITSLVQQIESTSSKKNSVAYSLQRRTAELTALKDEHKKILNNLKKCDRYTYEAVMWLKENQEGFRSKIYMPIMLEVKVNSHEYCKYIENHIAMRDMLAFVCEDKEDLKRLTEILRNQKNLPVNIVMTPDKPLLHFKSAPIPEEFKQSGLEAYLINFITAPAPVMAYLCSSYQIHNTPVSKSPVDEIKIESIVKKYRMFYNGNVKVCGTQSRYGNREWSFKQDFIANRNILVNTNDEVLRRVEKTCEELKTELCVYTEECDRLNGKLSNKEKEQEELRQERKKLMHYQTRFKSICSQLAMKKSYQSKLFATVIDEKEEKKKLSESIRSIVAAKLKVFCESSSVFKDLQFIHKQSVKEMLFMNSLSKELKLMKTENEVICDQVKEFERKINDLQCAIDEKKGPARELMEKIKKFTSLMSTAVASSKHSLEYIELEISHAQAQLNLIEDNEPLVKEYEDRKTYIASLAENIDRLKMSLEDLKENMEVKKKEWLESLEFHVNNINKKFGNYFMHLHCAGEISLDVPDNPNDFCNYGLQIRLKFRDDQPMKELSSEHHSGGECSVTAIIFILSLQELTEVPFRCIDEINQGMDSIYERKIFQLISESVQNNNHSQYFLLTPKLLMDLTYPDEVAVHVIHNSNFVADKLDLKKMLNIAKSLQK